MRGGKHDHGTRRKAQDNHRGRLRFWDRLRSARVALFPFLPRCNVFSFSTVAQRLGTLKGGPGEGCDTCRVNDILRDAPSGVGVMYAQTVLVDCKRNEGKEIRRWRKGRKK